MKRTVLIALTLTVPFGCGDDDTTTTTASGSSGGSSTATTTTTTTTAGTTTTTTAGTTTAGTTTAGTTTDATGGSTGSTGGSTGDSTGTTGNMVTPQPLYYWGDFVVNNLEEVGFIEFPNPMPSPLTLQGLGGDDIGGVTLSPDGMTLAVGGRDMAGSDGVINLYAADGSGAPTTLVTGAPTTDISRLAFSPDGTRLAFRADLDIDGAQALYVVPTAGGAPVRLSPFAMNPDLDLANFTWSPDPLVPTIAFTGDLGTNGVDGIWSVDASAAMPVAVELVPLAMLTFTQDVNTNFVMWDAAGRVYFKSDFEVDNTFRMYRVDPDAQNLEQVPGTALMNGGGEASIGSLGISPNGMQVAFSSNSPVDNVYEVFTMDVDMGVPAVVSNVAAVAPMGGNVSAPPFGLPIEWSPDGTMLAVVADWQLAAGDEDGTFGAFVLPSSGAAGGVRIATPPVQQSQDVVEVAFSRDSDWLLIRGDLVANNDGELYATDDLVNGDQDPGTIIVQDVPASGDVFDFFMVQQQSP